jgi:hypothetical protein
MTLIVYSLLGLWGTYVNIPAVSIPERKAVAILGITLSWIIPIAGIIIGYLNKERG